MRKAAARKGTPERRYWDSTVFLAWLLPEKDRAVDIRAVLDAAQRGKVQIITSVLTLTEVIKLKGHPSLRAQQHRMIDEFFKRSYIITRGLDRFTASEAREYIWKQGLQPKDSVHVATAVRARIRILETHDEDLLKLTGQLPVPGGAPLTIRKPHYSETLPLTFPVPKRHKGQQEQGS